MFSDPHLDAPPPPSQFRRPWSPEPYDPLPSTLNSRNDVNEPYSSTHFMQQQQPEYDYGDYPTLPHTYHRQQREASDVSVEALDLADYSRALRARQGEDPYPPFAPSHQQHDYFPPSPSLEPPSLISRGPTLSSSATHTTLRTPARRPFSLPPPSQSHQPSTSRSHASHSRPYIADPGTFPSEIDISQFPAWSRGWYAPTTRNAPRADEDIYTPVPLSHLDPYHPKNTKSPFDPGYIPSSYPEFPSSASVDPHMYGYAPPSSHGHDSARELVPWGSDPPDYSSGMLDPVLKEERMRMLEREFGPNAKGKKKREEDAFVDEDGKPLVGTVDAKGYLVTQGPKKRIAARTLQILLAMGAAVPSIYAALIIKPNPPAPPSGKPPAFVLYILSVLTLLLLLYLFLFRPCCCAPKRRKPSPSNPLANGMMVLPVPGLPGGKGKKPKPPKPGKGWKKGKGGGGPPGDVQVNLIVDPNAFGPQEESSEEEGEDAEYMPGGYDSSKRKRRPHRPRRRGLFAGLAMEEDWRRARAWAKKVAVVDGAGTILWGAAFVYLLIGQRCPSGGFGGWCNAYNVSTASACLLSVAFGISTFFDVKDLSASSVSPRSRS